MAKISEITIDELLFQEGSAPTTPASTKWKAYFKTDGLYVIDDAGTEYGPLTGASTFSGAKATRGTTQSIPDATITDIGWTSETYDTDSYHDNVTNPERMTVTDAGKYLVTASLEFAANTTGGRFLMIYKNTTRMHQVTQTGNISTFAAAMNISAVLDLSASDYVKIAVYQNSSGSLNVNADYNHFSVTKL